MSKLSQALEISQCTCALGVGNSTCLNVSFNAEIFSISEAFFLQDIPCNSRTLSFHIVFHSIYILAVNLKFSYLHQRSKLNANLSYPIPFTAVT